MKTLVLIASVMVVLFLVIPNKVEAQKSKTMTGTVVKTISGNKWAGIVIKVGNKKYGIQTDYNYSAGDNARGYRASLPKLVGDVEKVGRKVRIYYTKIDCSFAYEDNVPCWLKASKIVGIK